MTTKQLNPKYILPAIAALGTKSPSLQRFKLEELYVETLEILRADITSAHQYVQNFEALKEGEIAIRTAQTLNSFDHIHSILPVHTAQYLLGDRERHAEYHDESRLVWSYGISSMPQLESAITDITKHGLEILCKKVIGSETRFYFAAKREDVDKVRQAVTDYHTKALEVELQKHQAKLDEAKFQFEMFKTHYKSRCKEIVDLKTLETSPLLQ